MSQFADNKFQSMCLFKNQQDVLELTKPLSDYLKINYFHFRRTFLDGSYIVLSTDGEWPEYFIKNNIPVATPISQEYYDENNQRG